MRRLGRWLRTYAEDWRHVLRYARDRDYVIPAATEARLRGGRR